MAKQKIIKEILSNLHEQLAFIQHCLISILISTHYHPVLFVFVLFLSNTVCTNIHTATKELN